MKQMDNQNVDQSADIFRAHIDTVFLTKGDALFADLVDGQLSYAACKADMTMLAAIFDQVHLQQGDRALILSGNDRATIALVLALLRAGITPVIGDRSATYTESLEMGTLADVNAVFCDADHPLIVTIGNPPLRIPLIRLNSCDGNVSVDIETAKLQQQVKRNSAEIALMVLTSGTTSAPKVVALTHANLLAQFDIFRQVYGFDAQMRLLNTLPLHHVDGLIRGPLAALWVGGSVHRAIPFAVNTIPRILASVSALAITHFITVPAMLRIIDRVGRDQPDALRTPWLRFVISSADWLDPTLWKRFEEAFGVRIVNAYGLSEVVCDALFTGLNDNVKRIGTLGRAVGCSARVVDERGAEVLNGEIGELVLSGPTVMQGYFAAPEANAATLKYGDFHTGDFVRVDADGIFEFVGRKKTAIVSAGSTIHPEAATQVLSGMPFVLEAVAFGVPDAAMGERLVAAIVPLPGHEITPAQASSFCRLYLSPERSPREFRIVPVLPRGASGKVILSELITLGLERIAQPANKDVISIAAQCFNLPLEKLSLSSTPFNTDGWDSLAHMALIEALEDAFSIQFSAMQIAQIMSLEDAQKFVVEAGAMIDSD